VVVRGQHLCIPPQPYIQPRSWCLHWRPDNLAHVESARRVLIRIVGCNFFAKVPDKLGRKLGEKAFRGVMVDYTHDVPWYRVLNHVTRRITTSVRLVFHKTTPGLGARPPIERVHRGIGHGRCPRPHPIHIRLPLTRTMSTIPLAYLRQPAHAASGLTPFTTENLWQTYPIILPSLSQCVATIDMVRPKRTFSNSQTWP
jgi:hypothetical protein